MVESRMQQFKDLCKKKIQAKASVQESTEVKEVKDIKEDVGNTEPKKNNKKKEEVPEREVARYVSLPSGNFLIFN
jgi:alkyl hydroperoxide reductase subunit AhpF